MHNFRWSEDNEVFLPPIDAEHRDLFRLAGALQQACREAWQLAGLPKRVSPHSLRHAFAAFLLENNVDTRVIQVLLGHSRIETTARYTAVSPAKIAATASPLDQLLVGPRRRSQIKPRKG